LNTHKAAQHKKAVKNNIHTIVQIKELKAYRLFKRARLVTYSVSKVTE